MPLPRKFWEERAKPYKPKKKRLRKALALGLAGVVGVLGVRGATRSKAKPPPTHKTSVTIVEKGNKRTATVRKKHLVTGEERVAGRVEFHNRKNSG